jgi:hypothetical protein
LASLPTGGAPLSCRFAFNDSAHYRQRRLNPSPPWRRNPAHSGSVPNVAVAWSSSRDLRRLSFNSVLHPFGLEPRHETTIPSSPTRCPSPPAGVVRTSCPQTSSPLPTSPRTFAPTPPKLQPNQSCRRSCSLPYLLPMSFSEPQTPLNSHTSLPTGGFLQTAVSDAPPQNCTNLPAHFLWGRIRYSTSVCQY